MINENKMNEYRHKKKKLTHIKSVLINKIMLSSQF